MIVVAGGDTDPNILFLLQRLADSGLPHRALCVGSSGVPSLTWTLSDDRLSINGATLRPTALFLRYDVFTYLGDRRPESRRRAARWYQAWIAWVLAHEDVAFLNRKYGMRQPSKPYMLHRARCLGLDVPDSIVTNEPVHHGGSAEQDWIVKPIDGGEYTRTLTDAHSDNRWTGRDGQEPMIMQRRLVPPDLRIYRINDRWFAFALQSRELDYRTTRDVTIQPVPEPTELIRPLGQLMDEVGLDFGAADFKTCPDTGCYRFLEVNSAPMFAAFDRIAKGCLSAAILEWLRANSKG
jgi:hypothetical protein